MDDIAYHLSYKQQLAFTALHEPESPYTRVLYGGAAGGGKSVLGCAFQAVRRLEYPETRGFIGRKVRQDLIKSTFKTFQQVYNKIAFPRIGAMKYNGQTDTVFFPNGSEIQFLHLEETPSDPEFQRLGSYEFTDGFIDEVGECSKNAIDVIYSRIRHNLINDKKALLLASNPSYGWLKDTWVSKPDGTKIILPYNWKYIQAKVSDNPDVKFRDEYIRTLEEMPEYHRLRLLDGDWDYQINDAPYYPQYTHSCIVDKIDFNPNVPILLSFDFNYSPCTVTLLQGHSGFINAVKVIQAEGGTIPLCDKILEYLKLIGWNGSLRVTGDSTGHKRDTRSGVSTDFSQIQSKMNIPQGWINYNNRSNTHLDRSRDLINLCFHLDLIRISREGCPELIQDLNIAKPLNDKTAEFKKDRDRYKMDVLDSWRYGIHNFITDDNEARIFKNLYR
jgi:hypothetical protein